MIKQDELKELIYYNPETGIFTNKVTRNSRAIKGKELNPSNNGKYGIVTINKQKYYLHILAWFYSYGVWPSSKIDHKNRVTTDNRIDNLRKATNQQNQSNKGIQKNNKTGFKGVSIEGTKYKAQIQKDGKGITIGRFNTAKEAAIAYDEKALEVFGTFAFTNFK